MASCKRWRGSRTVQAWTRKHLPAVACVFFAVGAAHAQQPVEVVGGMPAAYPTSQPTSGSEFALTPYIWLPALRGTLDTPFARVGERSCQLGSGTVFTDIDSVPLMLAGEARYARFAVVGDNVYVGLRQDLNTRDILFEGGYARVVNTIATLLGVYRVMETQAQWVELGGGLRYWRFNEKLSLNPGLVPGAILKTTASWAEPVLAARYLAALSPRLGVSLYGDVGGFDAAASLSW